MMISLQGSMAWIVFISILLIFDNYIPIHCYQDFLLDKDVISLNRKHFKSDFKHYNPKNHKIKGIFSNETLSIVMIGDIHLYYQCQLLLQEIVEFNMINDSTISSQDHIFKVIHMKGTLWSIPIIELLCVIEQDKKSIELLSMKDILKDIEITYWNGMKANIVYFSSTSLHMLHMLPIRKWIDKKVNALRSLANDLKDITKYLLDNQYCPIFMTIHSICEDRFSKQYKDALHNIRHIDNYLMNQCKMNGFEFAAECHWAYLNRNASDIIAHIERNAFTDIYTTAYKAKYLSNIDRSSFNIDIPIIDSNKLTRHQCWAGDNYGTHYPLLIPLEISLLSTYIKQCITFYYPRHNSHSAQNIQTAMNISISQFTESSLASSYHRYPYPPCTSDCFYLNESTIEQKQRDLNNIFIDDTSFATKETIQKQQVSNQLNRKESPHPIILASDYQEENGSINSRTSNGSRDDMMIISRDNEIVAKKTGAYDIMHTPQMNSSLKLSPHIHKVPSILATTIIRKRSNEQLNIMFYGDSTTRHQCRFLQQEIIPFRNMKDHVYKHESNGKYYNIIKINGKSFGYQTVSLLCVLNSFNEDQIQFSIPPLLSIKDILHDIEIIYWNGMKANIVYFSSTSLHMLHMLPIRKWMDKKVNALRSLANDLKDITKYLLDNQYCPIFMTIHSICEDRFSKQYKDALHNIRHIDNYLINQCKMNGFEFAAECHWAYLNRNASDVIAQIERNAFTDIYTTAYKAKNLSNIDRSSFNIDIPIVDSNKLTRHQCWAGDNYGTHYPILIPLEISLLSTYIKQCVDTI